VAGPGVEPARSWGGSNISSLHPPMEDDDVVSGVAAGEEVQGPAHAVHAVAHQFPEPVPAPSLVTGASRPSIPPSAPWQARHLSQGQSRSVFATVTPIPLPLPTRPTVP
jgi:hypothetical protein